MKDYGRIVEEYDEMKMRVAEVFDLIVTDRKGGEVFIPDVTLNRDDAVVMYEHDVEDRALWIPYRFLDLEDGKVAAEWDAAGIGEA